MSALNNLEIEKKFLIEIPNITVLQTKQGYSRTEISQTYINDEKSNLNGRVRKRGSNGNYVYTKTFKQDITSVTRIEIEREISEVEYNRLLLNRKDGYNTIVKDRITFTYNGRVFEIDIYPFWSDKAIMEVELDNEADADAIKLPPFIKILKDVTDDKTFRNSYIALYGTPLV